MLAGSAALRARASRSCEAATCPFPESRRFSNWGTACLLCYTVLVSLDASSARLDRDPRPVEPDALSLLHLRRAAMGYLLIVSADRDLRDVLRVILEEEGHL